MARHGHCKCGKFLETACACDSDRSPMRLSYQTAAVPLMTFSIIHSMEAFSNMIFRIAVQQLMTFLLIAYNALWDPSVKAELHVSPTV